MHQKTRAGNQEAGWLLFFYTVPARPVGNRMRIWRKLARIGAIQLKGAVYLLPDDEENRELLQWLVTEAAALGGEAGFAPTARVFPFADQDLHELFTHERIREYAEIARAVDIFGRRLASVRKGSRPPARGTLRQQFQKIRNDFQAVRKIDFFGAQPGRALEKRLVALEPEVLGLTDKVGQARQTPVGSLARLAVKDFQGCTWATRPHPFVDRMASAWLIRRFIDPQARFAFLSEEGLAAAKGDILSFDVSHGDFTHGEDLCTFEVLVLRFGLNDPSLQRLGEIIHDLDLKDAKFGHPETTGVETVLAGIRGQAKGDQEILDQGMVIFDALRASCVPAAPARKRRRS